MLISVRISDNKYNGDWLRPSMAPAGVTRSSARCFLLHRFYKSYFIFSGPSCWSSRVLINLVDTFLPTLSTLSDLCPSPPLCGSAAAAEKDVCCAEIMFGFNNRQQLHNAERQIASDGKNVKVGGSMWDQHFHWSQVSPDGVKWARQEADVRRLKCLQDI